MQLPTTTLSLFLFLLSYVSAYNIWTCSEPNFGGDCRLITTNWGECNDLGDWYEASLRSRPPPSLTATQGQADIINRSGQRRLVRLLASGESSVSYHGGILEVYHVPGHCGSGGGRGSSKQERWELLLRCKPKGLVGLRSTLRWNVMRVRGR
ncbi:hypothetical protein BU16DRAFT_523624 [Lophium mytilinum]|uniref:Uncharacterized protein n=1 Tax=Lophium mytilinum TaxID=390894 RepID=A0A6A6R2S0_9PEZI|nr:hypothetical protein BU16DRAFT_523624 [Lophium mytilinum]